MGCRHIGIATANFLRLSRDQQQKNKNLEAGICHCSCKVKVCIPSPLQNFFKLATRKDSQLTLIRNIPEHVMHIIYITGIRTLQIHRLCIIGLRREIPTYPQKRKKENCISAVQTKMSELVPEDNKRTKSILICTCR